ncbi:hypothetical protein MTBBW1_1790043 [Desulfamplus magnetovallimortis]|uniref:TerD domain-containing protein n=1 Tax=Desulfamplus magnetovallimortis TaxID=1246637 RepID=A0A1W1HAL8_9BACT|nr:hypothetical protein MTBBW1_1790043 [Desulfamplus magnetovallimortis]
MAISLTKGGNISLEKVAPGLTSIALGLGWDQIEKKDFSEKKRSVLTLMHLACYLTKTKTLLMLSGSGNSKARMALLYTQEMTLQEGVRLVHLMKRSGST